MAGKGRGLRAQASAFRPNAGFQANIDKLLEKLDDVDRAEVLDLLRGEPLLPHVSVARVLTEHFADQLEREVNDRQVLDWRRKHGIRLRA